MTIRQPQASPAKKWHVILASVMSVIVSLGTAYFAQLGKAGPPGQPGTTTIIQQVEQAGLCVYFGKDANGVTRLQVWTPSKDSAGMYCAKGHLVSVTPAK